MNRDETTPGQADLEVAGSQVVEGEVVKPPRLNRPDPNSIKTHPIHKKAKVVQRQTNFTNKFEAALDEIAAARSYLQQLERHLEPGTLQPIDLRLNIASRHIEYIWRESGLKQ